MAFDNNYAEFYDLFYQDKNYKKETDYIHQLIKKHTAEENISVLDLACGTGKHAFELEKLGYTVTGSDISADMINIAVKKASETGSKVSFFNHSFQEANHIPGTYDVIISMFSAINYLTDFEDFNTTLTNIYSLLKPNGVLIFDYWNGNAVTRDYSPLKILRKVNGESELMRISETDLDLFNQIANVNFTCIYFKDNIKQVEFKELHRMRYFYFKELENLLSLNNFKISSRSQFLDIDGELDPYNWNISIIAQKS